MRVWLVTARDHEGKFLDQRRVEAPSQYRGESDAYDWIKRVGGDVGQSTIEEIIR